MYGNALEHKVQQAVQTAEQCGFEILPHPAYSPDLASLDFFPVTQFQKITQKTSFL